MIPPGFSKLVRRHARNGAVVDTNLLLLLWIGSFDRELIPRFKRTSSFLLTDFDLLVTLLKPLSRLVVTPHILTEVSNFSGYLPDPLRDLFRSQLVSIIGDCDERTAPSATLTSRPSFPRLGLTDVALVELAASGVLVVTDDLPLSLSLQERRLPFLNFTRLRRELPGYL